LKFRNVGWLMEIEKKAVASDIQIYPTLVCTQYMSVMGGGISQCVSKNVH